jgi:hypothetical protein
MVHAARRREGPLLAVPALADVAPAYEGQAGDSEYKPSDNKDTPAEGRQDRDRYGAC